MSNKNQTYESKHRGLRQAGAQLLDIARSRVWPFLRRLLAPEYRKRYRAWVFQGYIVVSLVAFAVLTVFASLMNHFEIDLDVTHAVQSTTPGWFGTFLVWVSWPGYVTGSIVTIVSITCALLLFGLRWESLTAFATAVSAWLVNNVIKIAIQRPRPDSDLVDVFYQLTSYSFPSGHVMFYSAFFGFLAFLSFTLVSRKWLRYTLVSIFSLMVVLVGLSRIYLGQHWASDVVAAYLLGFLILTAAVRVYRWGQMRGMSNTGGNAREQE